MTVGELIEELKKHAPDAHVLVRDTYGDHDLETPDISEGENVNTKQKFVIFVA